MAFALGARGAFQLKWRLRWERKHHFNLQTIEEGARRKFPRLCKIICQAVRLENRRDRRIFLVFLRLNRLFYVFLRYPEVRPAAAGADRSNGLK